MVITSATLIILLENVFRSLNRVLLEFLPNGSFRHRILPHLQDFWELWYKRCLNPPMPWFQWLRNGLECYRLE